MPRRKRRYLLLDGRELNVTADLEDDHAWSSIVHFTVAGQVFEFTSSYLEFGRDVAQDLGITLSQAVSMGPGELRVGGGTTISQIWVGEHADDDPGNEPSSDGDFVEYAEKVVVGTWEGRKFSVHAVIWGGEEEEGVVSTVPTAKDFANLVWLFDQFVIAERSSGIFIHPRSRSIVKSKDASAFIEVPQVGLLDIRQASNAAMRDMPMHRGTSVLGGELFKQTVADGVTNGLRFLLLNDSAITWVLLGDEDPELSAERLADLEVVALGSG